VTPRRDRALRWYPRAWRERYGDELWALVEDYSENGRLRFRDRLDLVHAGLQMHRRSKRPAGLAQRRVVARVIGCAAAVVVLGSVTVEATTAQAATPTHHAVLVAGERGAVVAGAGSAAAFVLTKRSNNSNK
jgi:hypothetical protein